MIALKFQGQVSDGGKLTLRDRDLFDVALMKYVGQPVELVLQKPKKDKTPAQLRYLFGVVVPAMSEVTGFAEEEMYGILKRKYLTRHLEGGEEYVASLTQLTKEEVAAFIDKCLDLGVELGAEIVPEDKVEVI